MIYLFISIGINSIDFKVICVILFASRLQASVEEKDKEDRWLNS